ncbi:hypothetical protein GCM10023093_27300 [Nemorincola caseinilytica]|uniref:DUF4190 domain-containing protein n=1 Tax=Nemorincola caseinilytica TaxID=2054315 RepID=A0ABP8NKP9_9BACT
MVIAFSGLAVGFGSRAIRRENKYKGLAIAGLILGLVGLLAVVLYFTVLSL